MPQALCELVLYTAIDSKLTTVAVQLWESMQIIDIVSDEVRSEALRKATDNDSTIMQDILTIDRKIASSTMLLEPGTHNTDITTAIGFYAMEHLSILGWVPSLSVLTFGSFAMIATQGGIGAYQLAVQKTLLLYDIDAVNGLAFGWLLWLVQTVILFIIGPISVLSMYLLNKKKSL